MLIKNNRSNVKLKKESKTVLPNDGDITAEADGEDIGTKRKNTQIPNE